MSQCIWLQIFLNYILSFLSKDIDKVSFRKYLLGLIYEEKQFSVRRTSKKMTEVFHREAKQKLGLEFLMMQSCKKLTNYVGFVCLAYSLLTVLKQLSNGSIGDVKFKLTDEALGVSSAIDIIDLKLAS